LRGLDVKPLSLTHSYPIDHFRIHPNSFKLNKPKILEKLNYLVLKDMTKLFKKYIDLFLIKTVINDFKHNIK